MIAASLAVEHVPGMLAAGDDVECVREWADDPRDSAILHGEVAAPATART